MKKNIIKWIIPLLVMNLYATDDVKKIFIPAEQWTLIGINNCGPNKITADNVPTVAKPYTETTVLNQDTKSLRDLNSEYGKYFYVDNTTTNALTFYLDDNIIGNDNHLISHDIIYTDENNVSKTINLNYDSVLENTKIKLSFTNGSYFIDLPTKLAASTATSISSQFNKIIDAAGIEELLIDNTKYLTVSNALASKVELFTVAPDESTISPSYMSLDYYLQYDLTDDTSIVKITQYTDMEGSLSMKINDEIFTFRYDQLSTDSTNPTSIKPSTTDINDNLTAYGSLLDNPKVKNILTTDTNVSVFDTKENKILRIESSNIQFEIQYLNTIAQNMIEAYIEHTNEAIESNAITIQYPSSIKSGDVSDKFNIIVKGERKELYFSGLSKDDTVPTPITTDSTNTISLCSVENMIYTDLNAIDADPALTDSYLIYNYSRTEGETVGTWKRHTMGTKYESINDRSDFPKDEFIAGHSYWVHRTDSDTTDSISAENNSSGLKVDKYSSIDSQYYSTLQSGWNMVSFDDLKLIEDFKIYEIIINSGIVSDNTDNSSFIITNSAGTQDLNITLKNNDVDVFKQINDAVRSAKNTGGFSLDVNIQAYKTPGGHALLVSDSQIIADNNNSLIIMDKSKDYKYGIVLSDLPPAIVLKDIDNNDVSKSVITLDDNKTSFVLANTRFNLQTNTLETLVDNNSLTNDIKVYSGYSVSSYASETPELLSLNIPISGLLAPQYLTDNNPFQKFSKDIKSIWNWSNGNKSQKWQSTVFDTGILKIAENIENKVAGYDILSAKDSQGYWVNLGEDKEASALEIVEEDISIEIQYDKLLSGTLMTNSIMHNSKYTSTITCTNKTEIKHFTNMKIAFRLQGETVYGDSIDMIPNGLSDFKLKLYNNDILNKDSVKITIYDYRGDSASIEKDLTDLLADPAIGTPTMDNIENILFTSTNANFISIYNGDIDIDNDITTIDVITTNRVSVPQAIENGEYILQVSALNKEFGDSVNVKAYTAMSDFAPGTKYSNVEELDSVYVLNKDSRVLEMETDETLKMSIFDNTGTKTVLDEVVNTGISVKGLIVDGTTLVARTAIVYKDNDESRHDINTPNTRDFVAGSAKATISFADTRANEVVFLELNGAVYKIDNLNGQENNVAIDLTTTPLPAGITAIARPSKITLAE